MWAAPPWQIPKALPLTTITGTWRQKNMAQMKQQIKAPKIELSNEEIGNLSDAEFKTLVIRILTEIIEYGHKIEKEVKVCKVK